MIDDIWKLCSPGFIESTLNEVRLTLASQDAQIVDAERGVVHCEITGSMMIHMGLELEEQQ